MTLPKSISEAADCLRTAPGLRVDKHLRLAVAEHFAEFYRERYGLFNREQFIERVMNERTGAPEEV